MSRLATMPHAARALGVAGAVLGLALSGCDSILDVRPVDRLPSDDAIVNATAARAAMTGAYNSLQSLSYYGGTFIFFGDLSADNAASVGTLQSYADADRHELMADNGSIEAIWSAIYDGIARVNLVLEQVPNVTDLDETERNQILGEAHLLRALHHHNAVKLWGDVPLMLTTVSSPAQAAQVTRTPAAEVYAAILADLEDARTLMTDEDQRTRASRPAALALLARVHLYLGNWAQAEAWADSVLDMGLELAPAYADLFDATGGATTEDILRVYFDATDYNNVGYYYHTRSEGGRGEVTITADLVSEFESGDARADHILALDDDAVQFSDKFPTTAGTEDLHVIRLAEVMLIKAEAHARQDELAAAVDAYNPVRERAGLDPHELGVDVTTQQQVLDAIFHERRIELALEGDRWADLVRTGRAAAELGLANDELYQLLYPIPQSERAVALGLTQNDGY